MAPDRRVSLGGGMLGMAALDPHLTEHLIHLGVAIGSLRTG